MSVACQTITWGGVVGHPAGVTTIKDLWYLAYGSDEVAIREVAEAGYDGVELFDGNLQRFEDSPEKLESLLRETRLELLAVYSGANFIYGDVLDDEFYRIGRASKLGRQFGARYLTVGGGAIRASGVREADFESLARGLDRVVETAQKHGLEAMYHPHLGTISQDPDGLHRLMNLTEIALCLDTAHIAAGGGDPVEIALTYRQRIRGIHFKDYADGRFLPLGEGELDLAGVAAALGGTHDGTWWTVELDATDRPPLEVAKQNRRAIDQLVRART